MPADLPLNATPTMVAESLFWAYNRAKVAWRRFMGKPVRRARRFIRRHHQKGKGKGKRHRDRFRGKGGYYTYLAGLPNEEVESMYKGMSKAKGRGKGKKPDGTYWEEQTYYNRSSKSSGKGGFGRQQNPTGPDGKTMECWDCGSTQHLSKDSRYPNMGQE